MADKTGIEWCDSTWNPVRGCSRVSPGCGGPNHEGGCYAEKIAARFSAPGQPFHGFAERTPHGGRWTGKLALIENQLDLPLRWRRPRRIFVNSMSDLFHENLPDEAIDKVFAVMALRPQHTFQVLTKRAERMREYLNAPDRHRSIADAAMSVTDDLYDCQHIDDLSRPFSNVWLGVSVEDQARADERIPHLLATPAAVRFLSCEPLLGPIDLTSFTVQRAVDTRTFDWIIVGGESGAGARRFDVEWARSILAQCKAAGVPCFIKQLGADPWFGATKYGPASGRYIKDRKGGDWSEWPEDLRVREFPDGRL